MNTGIDAVEATAYTVPTPTPEADGTIAWQSTTIVVVHIRAGSTMGFGWTYGSPACLNVVNEIFAPVLLGRDPLGNVGCVEDMNKAVRNIGRQGIAGYALSAVDVALWDLKARLLGVPIVQLLGDVHTRVPVYGSGGFTTFTADQLREQLSGWVEGQSIGAVKIKIGESWGSRVDRDLKRMLQAREIIGPDTALFVDANGAYSAKQAIRVMEQAADADVVWFEEPVSSDDLAGLGEVRKAVRADVTAGEYGFDLTYFRRMAQARAVDCLQIDATRCGGYTVWMRAAAVAASFGLEVSAHCAPNLHAQVAAATPNVRHLEWFADHVRIEEMFFDGALDPQGGSVHPDRGCPGHGLTLRASDIQKYRVA